MNYILDLLKLFVCLQIFCDLYFVDAMVKRDLVFVGKYVGCYRDSRNNRALDKMYRKHNSMTVAMCKYHCVGYKYFGVESADECYCGWYPDKIGKAREGLCNQPCAGNSTIICGGSLVLSVYQRQDPQIHPGYDIPYKYKGCYKDKSNDRALTVQKTNRVMNMKMNILQCRYLCDSYDYFGVENGEQCFCGDSIKDHDGPKSGCTKKCEGSDTQKCGGRNRINIYEKKTYNTSNHGLYHDDPRNMNPQTPHHLGCYADTASKPSLPFHRLTHLPMSVGVCDRLCFPFKFFAIQNGFDCYCGQLYGTGSNTQKYASHCNTQCNTLETGDPMGCGGTQRNSVYVTSVNPFVNDTIDFTSTYLGCYADVRDDRDLPLLRAILTKMTLEKCQKLCFDYNFLGLQNGNECWCGNRFGKHGSVGNTQCDKNCAASEVYDGGQQCGGGLKNSVYAGLNIIVNI